ncbi:hypothetical protein [Planococcus sp. CAU13]|uniref:hypothetical protein n=1 Tax=Planococcus sp. CAU13 TaxID=1541197 RepID=UPI00052FFF93|nr:hypothetical protein [Planococcus sp. CAU13]
MDLDYLPHIFYVLFFFFFVYKALQIVNSYIFARAAGWYTYPIIFLFTLICPLLYSSFSIGAIVLLLRTPSGHMPMEWAVPFLYILCGYLFMSQPFDNYYKERKLALYAFSIACFWLVIGALITVINPEWNNQLERNLNTNFPSIGQFLILTNLCVIVLNGLFYKYFIVEAQNEEIKVRDEHAKIK